MSALDEGIGDLPDTRELYAGETTGERISRMRRRNKWKIRDVEGRTGISRARLSRIERGESKADEDDLIALARAFRVSSDYIIGLAASP
jgi:transcriptional regulator with XRE-family HTH domain